MGLSRFELESPPPKGGRIPSYPIAPRTANKDSLSFKPFHPNKSALFRLEDMLFLKIGGASLKFAFI